MKKLIIAAVALCCATVITVQAQDAAPKKHAKLTAEQKQLKADMLAKYDTNKDGKLDKAENAAMTKEDKDKLVAAGLAHGKKKADAAPAADPAK